jgi:hypothetical protein
MKTRLKDNDDQLIHLQTQINKKRELLDKKQKQLKQKTKQNEHLEHIRQQYMEDHKQLEKTLVDGFGSLSDYLNKLLLSGQLSEQNQKDAKVELTKITNEIKIVKKQYKS